MSNVSKISIDDVLYDIEDTVARNFIGDYKSIDEVIKEIETTCIDSINKSILGGVS